MGCVGSKSREFDREILDDIPTFYKFMRKRLKAEKFKFKSSDGISLRKKLSACYGISKKTAKVWITLYVDYMIQIAFHILKNRSRDMCIYPPYAIQQVLKVHVADTKNFWEFDDILLYKRGDIPYVPRKLETIDNYHLMLHVYKQTKKSMKQNLYANLSLLKSIEWKEEAKDIWEKFNLTLMQCEFNFCFFNKEAKENFQKILVDHPEEIEMQSQNPEEIMRVKKVIRELLGIGDLIDDSTYRYEPSIQPLKPNYLEKKILEKLDKFSFSAEFINILAWEQRITTEEAQKWIEEYKKFMFLVQIAPLTKLSPSEAVDQVWHLHTLFVEKYGEDIFIFRKIHFCPAKGDLGEIEKQKNAYSETLKRYNACFGSPDEKIWPSAEQRVLDSGRWATYYFAFAKKCLTIQQSKKLQDKYKERIKERQPDNDQEETQKQKEKQKHEEEKKGEDKYWYKDDTGVSGGGFLVLDDPFNPSSQPEKDLPNEKGDSQILDIQNIDNDKDDRGGRWWSWNSHNNDGNNNDIHHHKNDHHHDNKDASHNHKDNHSGGWWPWSSHHNDNHSGGHHHKDDHGGGWFSWVGQSNDNDNGWWSWGNDGGDYGGDYGGNDGGNDGGGCGGGGGGGD